MMAAAIITTAPGAALAPRRRALGVVAIGRRLRAIDRAIDALSDDDFDRGQIPLQIEAAGLKRLLVSTPARDLAGLATKLRVACEVLDWGDAIEAEDLVASALRDVDRMLGRVAND